MTDGASANAASLLILTRRRARLKPERDSAAALEEMFAGMVREFLPISPRGGLPPNMLLPMISSRVEARRTPARAEAHRTGEALAQRGYNDTIKRLRKLGLAAQYQPLSREDRAELFRELDRTIDGKFDRLPQWIYDNLDRLRYDPSLSDWHRQQAKELARQIATYAEPRGQYAAHQEQGTGYHMWVNRGDLWVRRSHRRIDQEVARIGDTFSNGCRYPRDPLGPPGERFNCRCHTFPVIPHRRRRR